MGHSLQTETDGHCSCTRKAYRLGKWLADLNKARKLPLDSRRSLIEVGACLGEGIYYFSEQFTWQAPV